MVLSLEVMLHPETLLVWSIKETSRSVMRRCIVMEHKNEGEWLL